MLLDAEMLCLSVMLFNTVCCRALTPALVNTASGLHLHQFQWLAEEEISPLPPEWTVLVEVQPVADLKHSLHAVFERLALTGEQEAQLLDEAEDAFRASQSLQAELADRAPSEDHPFPRPA